MLKLDLETKKFQNSAYYSLANSPELKGSRINSFRTASILDCCTKLV